MKPKPKVCLKLQPNPITTRARPEKSGQTQLYCPKQSAERQLRLFILAHGILRRVIFLSIAISKGSGDALEPRGAWGPLATKGSL
jgi:hypothetical protein